MYKKFAWCSLLLCSLLYASAQANPDLFQAYLRGDMDTWGTFLAETDKRVDWTVDELAEILTYEYGYLAWSIDEKRIEESKHRLQQFEDRIEVLAQAGYDPSMVAVYRSSVSAYQLSLYKKKVIQTMKNAMYYSDKAVELGPDNPIALTLQGNVRFYTPAMFGGSKEEALQLFLRSEELMRTNGQMTVWNYPALLLCIAQAYEKTDGKKRAVAYCEEVLQRYPDFAYLREFYEKMIN